ncbi:Hypothetical protein HVR_LOCUS164 [uncultured virus]|nr:Hypothetical protein HVR_LOCUS164 [uncultured virus]
MALILFAIIVLIAAVIAWYMKDYNQYDKGSFHTFISILIGLGIFVTFMFYYNLIQLQQQQQTLAAIQELSRINDSLLNSVLDEIKQASETIPNFVLSITPLTNTICMSTASEDPVNPQTCTEKMVLSFRIFSLWQDVIVSDRFINLDPASYIANFLQRANSQQLYQEWTVNRLNFRPDTQAFGDLLFEYALPITDQVPASYVNAAQKLIDHPRYKEIFKIGAPC